MEWRSAAPLVVIGRNALKDDPAVAARLEPYVRAGGRVLICAQDPEWMTRALGWRVCPKVGPARFPHEFRRVTRGMDADDLRDWTGSSTLIEAYPEYVGRLPQGQRSVSSPTPDGIGATAAASAARPSRSPTAAAGVRCWNANSIWPTRR